MMLLLYVLDLLLYQFPSEWPSTCPADITAELDVLSQRCLDLTHCFTHSDSGRAERRRAAGRQKCVGGRRGLRNEHLDTESQDVSQVGSSFGVDRDQEKCVCVCVIGTSHEREYESLRMLEGLERMTADLLTCADQQKKGTSQSLSSCPSFLCHFQVRVHEQSLFLVLLLICKTL